MAFAFEAEEEVSTGVVRILKEELDGARLQLEESRLGRPDAVHEYRRRLKKARSLVRLARFVVSDKKRRSVAQNLAEATRLFAFWRDQEAVMECIDSILESSCEPSVAVLCGRVRDALNARASAEELDADALKNAAVEAEKLLADVCGEADRWAKKAMSWSAICKGIRCSYRDARMAMHQACADAQIEHLHLWRKQSKDLRHHLLLVSRAWPAYFKNLESEFHALTDALGEAHDLELLRTVLQEGGDGLLPGADRAEMDAYIAREIQVKAGIAFQQGVFLFAEKPAAFHRRMVRYIALWTGEGNVAVVD